jgi:hypothetical protein
MAKSHHLANPKTRATGITGAGNGNFACKRGFMFSRCDAPELCKNFAPGIEGAGKCRVRSAPAASCAKTHIETHTKVTGTDGATRHSLRNGFTAYAALSSVTNSFLSPSLADEDLTESGWARKTSASLAPATGVGTTRFCRTLKAPFVLRAARIAHELSPPCDHDCAPTLSRPPHPVPTFVTMANALFRGGMAGFVRLSLPLHQEEYFLIVDLTQVSDLPAEADQAAKFIRLR